MTSTSRPEEFHRVYTEAFNSGDVQRLLDLYEQGGALVDPDKVLSGHPAVAESLRRYQAVGTMTARTRYCIQCDDVALASAAWSIEGSGSAGEPVAMSGRSSDLIRRQPDGRWLLVVDHPFGSVDDGSSPQSPSTPATEP